MRKWRWWWVPGFHKRWKLEERRIEAPSNITGERLYVELMAQRPRAGADALDSKLLTGSSAGSRLLVLLVSSTLLAAGF